MKVDLEELRNALTNEEIISLVYELGVTHHQENDRYIMFPTICHNESEEGASLKLYYFKEIKLFHCFTECSQYMSIFNLFRAVYELRGVQYNFYTDIIKVILDKAKLDESLLKQNEERYKSIAHKYRKIKREVEIPIVHYGVLDTFQEVYPAQWLSEGISEETMREYGILFSISQNKIVIPHYDINNNLIGIRGRAIDENEAKLYGKYRPICVEGKTYSHPVSLNLYGLNFSKGFIDKKKQVVIFEGEKSVLKYRTYFPTENISAAVCGSAFNKNQLNLLLNNSDANEIIIAFDREYKDYNSEEADRYFMKLYELCQKYSHYIRMSFIFDEGNLIGYKDAPIDCGKENFIELFNNRIIV